MSFGVSDMGVTLSLSMKVFVLPVLIIVGSFSFFKFLALRVQQQSIR